MTYTIRDICDHFGVHEQTALGWVHSGQLKAMNVGVAPGKKKPRWRITQQALDDFEAMRSTSQPAPKTRRRRKQPSDVIQFIK